MSAQKTSAIADQEPVDVLFAIHEKFDLLDFAGALEVFTTACHDFKNPDSKQSYLPVQYSTLQHSTPRTGIVGTVRCSSIQYNPIWLYPSR